MPEGTFIAASSIKPAAKNFAWLFADKLLKFGLTVLTTALIVRYLGPERFGQLNYATAFCSIFGFLILQGMDQLIVRELVQKPKNAGQILGTVFGLRIFGALLSLAVMLGSAFFFGNRLAHSAPLVAVLAFSYLANSCDFADLWFQSISQTKWTVLSRQTSLVLSSLAKVALILFKAPLVAFATVQALESVVTAGVQFLNFKRRQGPELKFEAFRENAAKLLKQGWPLLAVSLTVLIYSKADQLILGNLRPISEVAYYSSALRILDYVNIFPMILSTSIFPLLAKAYQDPLQEQSREEIQSFLSAINWMAWIGTIGLFLLSNQVVRLLYGAEFHETASILRIICWIIPLVFFSVIRQAWLTIRGLLGTAIRFELTVALLSLSLNLLLVPKYGARGSAVTLLATTYFSNGIGILLLPPIREAASLYLRSLLLPTTKILNQT